MSSSRVTTPGALDWEMADAGMRRRPARITERSRCARSSRQTVDSDKPIFLAASATERSGSESLTSSAMTTARCQPTVKLSSLSAGR